jgi:hypothetical protein
MFGFLMLLNIGFAQDSAEIEAERNQIRSEMERFQRQQLWMGLNKKYQLLLETVEKPTELLYEDHLMGAIAAQEMGELNTAIQRYEWLAVVEPTAQEIPWLEYLQSQTVYVGLECPQRQDGSDGSYLPEEITFGMVNPPFEPELILAVNVAEEALKNDCIFKGNLPLGEYQFMGRTLPITEWDKLEVLVEEEMVKKTRVTTDTQGKISSFISTKAIVAREDVFHVHVRGGLIGAYVGDSMETGPAPFGSLGPLLGVGSRREFADTAFVLGTDLTFRGTYQGQGNLLGGGLSFWAGIPFQVSDSKLLFYGGGLLDISKVERVGLTGNICLDEPVKCAESAITAVPTSSGVEIGIEFGTIENRYYNLRASTRSDSERWYSSLELSVVHVF